MTKASAMIFGPVFVLMGIAGFVPNPVVGINGFFVTDTLHNLIHIVLGGFLVLGPRGLNASVTLKTAASIFLLFAIFGFVMGEGKLLGLVRVNTADNWLHLVLAMALFAGSVAGSHRPAIE